MDNHELLMLERKLEKARADLLKLFSLNNEFYMYLMKILDTYKSSYFYTKKYEIKFSTLFRIMTNRVQSKDLDIKQYSEMKLAVQILEFRHPNEFTEFVRIIKFHVDSRNNLGYNQICRLIYGESTGAILEKYCASSIK